MPWLSSIGLMSGTSYDGVDVHLYKSADQKEVTPSAIFIDKRGKRYFGSRAYDSAARSPDNAAILFKRLMGTSTPVRLPAVNVELTPEECSAEILRVLYGYLPAFRRVRQFPTNQRFEPLVPGITFFLSDAWSSGDPMLTWGNFKTVGRQPFLGPISGNWQWSRPTWEKNRHGGGRSEGTVRNRRERYTRASRLRFKPEAGRSCSYQLFLSIRG